jgi:hypothetical protein
VLLHPGSVVFSGSSDFLILGTPFKLTNLYTIPNAGWAWHVTRFVPIPKESISWLFSLREFRLASFMSLLAIILSLEKSFPNFNPVSMNNYRASFDKVARSPESSLIPEGLYPRSCKTRATSRKFLTPDYIV